MKLLDVLIGLPMWKVYMEALLYSLKKPPTLPLAICKTPKTCRRKHRLAIVFKKGQPGRFVLVH